MNYHMHEDEDGNPYRCSNTGCDVSKNRMKKYHLLRHKEEELMEKYEKAVQIHDTIAKRRQSIAVSPTHHQFQDYNNNNNNNNSTHLDKRLNSILHSEQCTARNRRFSVPSKVNTKYRKHVTSQRPLSCLDESISEDYELPSLLKRPLSTSMSALSARRVSDTPPPSLSKTLPERLLHSPVSIREKLSLASETLSTSADTLLTSSSTSASTVCDTIQRLRKLSSSADDLDTIHRRKRISLQEMTRLLPSSADNIHLMSKNFHLHGNLYHVSRKHPSSVENLHSMTTTDSKGYYSPSFIRKHNVSQTQQRRIAANKKQEDRRQLIDSLNNDIKKANRYLRNLRTRSMPLLGDLQIDFEKLHTTEYQKSSRLNNIEKFRRISVDMIIV